MMSWRYDLASSTNSIGPMNVLLITADQSRGDTLGALGHECVRTPNLDALAKDAVLFARHYSQAVPCAPGPARR